MKTLFYFCCLGFLIVSLNTSCHRKTVKKDTPTEAILSMGIHFEKIPYKQALSTAKKNNKLIFIDMYTTWCMPCKMMDSAAFADKLIGDLHNANFINLKVDGEKAEGRELIEKYGVMGYPTLLYLDANGEVLRAETGSFGINQFMQLSKEVLKKQTQPMQ